MARAKKKTTAKFTGSGRGKRLTPETKAAIASEPAGVTLKELASKYATSINTVQKIRSGTTPTAAKGGRAARLASATGVSVTTDSTHITIRIPKTKNLLKGLISDLLAD